MQAKSSALRPASVPLAKSAREEEEPCTVVIESIPPTTSRLLLALLAVVAVGGHSLPSSSRARPPAPGYPAGGDRRQPRQDRLATWTGVTGRGSDELNTPVQATYFPSGHVLIADESNNRAIEAKPTPPVGGTIVWQ